MYFILLASITLYPAQHHNLLAEGLTSSLPIPSGQHTIETEEFQKLKNKIPQMEIIWGDEDNDEKLFLKCLKTGDSLVCNNDFVIPERESGDDISYPVIPKGSRIQLTEIWNETEGNFQRTGTITNASLSKILSEEIDSSFLNLSEPIELERSEIFEEKNFVLNVEPGQYLITVFERIPEWEIVAVYETRLEVLDSENN